MTIKKMLRLASLLAFITLTLPANSASLSPAYALTDSATNPVNIRMQQLVQRLEDIDQMDKSSLTRSEKKDLRKEVKSIKKEMKAANRGVYLSVGAIIIIILLLILLL